MEIAVPYDETGWPRIAKIEDKHCHRKKHRLYAAMDVPCPCGPVPMVVQETDVGEVRFYGNDIHFCDTDGDEIFTVKKLLERIEQLERKVEELSS